MHGVPGARRSISSAANADLPSSARFGRHRSRADLVKRVGFVLGCRSPLAGAGFALARLLVSSAHGIAVPNLRNDALWDPILSRPLPCGIAMEPIRVRGSLQCHWVRRIRACNSCSAYASTADASFDAARENVVACVSHLRTRAKLDLPAATLAQLLDALRLFSKVRFRTTPLWFILCGLV